MKLSIIIPFYNALPYFNELLTSLIPQITNDVEVIFVNDASTDESFKALYEHLRLPNIILLENNINKCVSYSRNKALDIAKGEYVWFVDADDIIPNNAVKRILNKINYLDSSIDIIVTNFEYFDDRAEEKVIDICRYPFDMYPTVNNRYQDKFEVFYGSFKICSMICNCIYNRKMLIDKKIYFNNNICIGETYLFKVLAFWYAETFGFIETPVYTYRMNRKDGQSLSLTMPPIETIKESIADYNKLFDMFFYKYKQTIGKEIMLELITQSFLLYLKVYIAFENLTTLQLLHERNVVDKSDYDKILAYKNITWKELLTGDNL